MFLINGCILDALLQTFFEAILQAFGQSARGSPEWCFCHTAEDTFTSFPGQRFAKAAAENSTFERIAGGKKWQVLRQCAERAKIWMVKTVLDCFTARLAALCHRLWNSSEAIAHTISKPGRESAGRSDKAFRCQSSGWKQRDHRTDSITDRASEAMRIRDVVPIQASLHWRIILRSVRQCIHSSCEVILMHEVSNTADSACRAIDSGVVETAAISIIVFWRHSCISSKAEECRPVLED